MRRVGILALQGDFEAHARRLRQLGLAPERPEAAGAAENVYRLVRQPADLEGLEALILPGGESSAMLRLLAPNDFLAHLGQFVRQRPVLATCAGAILLARSVSQPEQATLGVLDAHAVRNAYGRQIDSAITVAQVEPDWQPQLGESLEAVLIRAPQLERLGPSVDVVARAQGRPVLVVQGNVVAATFHPELSDDPRVHEWFLRRAAEGASQSSMAPPAARD